MSRSIYLHLQDIVLGQKIDREDDYYNGQDAFAIKCVQQNTKSLELLHDMNQRPYHYVLVRVSSCFRSDPHDSYMHTIHAIVVNDDSSPLFVVTDRILCTLQERIQEWSSRSVAPALEQAQVLRVLGQSLTSKNIVFQNDSRKIGFDTQGNIKLSLCWWERTINSSLTENKREKDEVLLRLILEILTLEKQPKATMTTTCVKTGSVLVAIASKEDAQQDSVDDEASGIETFITDDATERWQHERVDIHIPQLINAMLKGHPQKHCHMADEQQQLPRKTTRRTFFARRQ